MVYKLSPSQLKAIEKLPLGIQQLKDKYPVSISNVALDYNLPKLTEHDVVKSIVIYYGDDVDEADWFFRDGVTEIFNDRIPADPHVIRMTVNGDWAYIQIEGRVVFDRLGSVKLQTVFFDIESQLNTALPNLPF